MRLRRLVTAVRIVLAALAVVRLAGAARRLAPVRPTIGPVASGGALGSISVVIPARDEAGRIGPVLRAMVGAPGVHEVIVVDDQSGDDTAALAAAAGARVVTGASLPDGWAGKAWALQQGIEAAQGDWVVTLDADTRPHADLPGALVARAHTEGYGLLTVGGRFECPTPGAQWLHPAMLTTLVYRFGPSGVGTAVRPDRTMANGQCMTLRRAPFLAAGGMSLVAGHPVEDVALARRLAGDGWSVGFLDASDVLTVRMYESLADTWHGWGRSLALPGVEPTWRQLIDLAVVLGAMTMPLPRLLSGHGDVLDVGLVAVRLGTLAGTRASYERAGRRHGAAYWLSPLADLPATAAFAAGIVSRRQTWRGRQYATPTPPARTAAR